MLGTDSITQRSTAALGQMIPACVSTNPWVSDNVLLNLSLWWVQNTQQSGVDLPVEVGVVFRSLRQQLQ